MHYGKVKKKITEDIFVQFLEVRKQFAPQFTD